MKPYMLVYTALLIAEFALLLVLNWLWGPVPLLITLYLLTTICASRWTAHLGGVSMAGSTVAGAVSATLAAALLALCDRSFPGLLESWAYKGAFLLGGIGGFIIGGVVSLAAVIINCGVGRSVPSDKKIRWKRRTLGPVDIN
jgi:hypothetical protein